MPSSRFLRALTVRGLAALLTLAVGVSSPLSAQDAGGHGGGAAPAEAAEATGWTPELSMQFRSVGSTVLSPDGSRVAFTVREPLMEGEQSEYRTHVWVAATDGSGSRQFTQGDESAGSPSFSPDGSHLLFTTSRSGKNQVWALPLQGGEAFQVTDAEEGVGSYAISPDGSHLAYTMRDPASEEWEEAQREKRDVIVADSDFRFTHLYVGPFRPGMNGGLQPHAHRMTEGDFTVTQWDWSPAGRSIVFAHQEDPLINTGFMNSDLSIVHMPEHRGGGMGMGEGGGEGQRAGMQGEGGMMRGEGSGGMSHGGGGHGGPQFTVEALVTRPGTEGNPLFSPSGDWIAFESSGEQSEPVGLADIWVVRADGSGIRKLHETHDRNGGLMGWVEEGTVWISESIGTTRHLQVLTTGDQAPGQFSSGQGVIGSAHAPLDVGLVAFTWQTPDQPADVYVSPTHHWDPVRITDLHSHIETPEMGRTELLTWTSQDGRFQIEGLLTYPVGYEEGERVPLILNVHGGPAGVFSQSFTGSPSIYMVQTFAERGYAVLRPNPRGSTGYGKDFRYANVRDWGYGDMDDLMAGVDHVIDMGVGDPDQLLLMGWSYGGYMTSFAVTRTDRFKAASMGAGLPNLVSMVTTTDIQDYLVGHLDSELWDDYDAYERHSAMYRIANVTTPTQVIHGENDLRVPFTQGQEFYRALQRLDVPTEMLILPRTPHGPREPKLLMEVTPRILEWFERHLPERASVTQ